jgi:hypothetical protein
MKQVLTSIAFVAIFSIISLVSFAQEEEQQAPPAKCKWVSEKGYWVVESNIKSKSSSIIHFYNNNDTEIYSEKVEGKVLNVSKRKTLKLLSKALDASLLAWEKSQKPREDLVKNIMTAK